MTTLKSARALSALAVEEENMKLRNELDFFKRLLADEIKVRSELESRAFHAKTNLRVILNRQTPGTTDFLAIATVFNIL